VTKCNGSDEQLIDQFLTGARDDTADTFEVLVKRHGPMMMGVWETARVKRGAAEIRAFVTIGSRSNC